MSDKARNIVNIVVAALIIFGLSLFSLIDEDKDWSYSERRGLAKFPEVSLSGIFAPPGKTSVMNEFETYFQDQFPMRESFRQINAVGSTYLLGKKENNNLCLTDDYITKLEYNINEDSVEWSLNRINYITDNYLADSSVYFAIIPDKNYYLSGKAGYITYDYDEFIDKFRDSTRDKMTFVDLRDQLGIKNYYYTDTHWKQETLLGVTDLLLYTMTGKGFAENTDNTILCETLLTDSFEGVYYSQLALPVKKDSIMYMTGHYVDDLKAYCYDTGAPEKIDVYDKVKGSGEDPYQMFLTGSRALITIENPNATEDRELIVFRDSFGSSIAPLLAGGYSKVTLVDIRYISPAMIGRFVDFEGRDVLFLYSSQILNNSVGQFNN